LQETLAHAISEKALQHHVEQLARLLGYTCFHARDSRGQNLTGLPDLLLVKPGRCLWIELKAWQESRRTWNRPTPVQVRTMRLLEEAGQEVHLWDSRDWVRGEIERVLKEEEGQ
jgi:hypothetical protein